MRIAVDDGQACERSGAGDDGHDEGAPAERQLELGPADANGVGREVDGRQVCRRRHRDRAEDERRRVEPARDEVALGVADRDAARRDAADRRAEREGREDRGAGEEDLDPALLACAPCARAQGVGRAAQDDADPRDEERDGERRGDRAEGRRIGRPADHEHEDQPDVVGLPDGAHGVVGVLAQRLVALAAAAQQLPEARAEVGAAQHCVRGQSDEHQDDRELGESHRVPPPAGTVGTARSASSMGARARRRSSHATATASPA